VRAIQTGQLHVGDQQLLLLVGGTEELDAERPAHRALPAVGADQVTRGDHLAGVERDPDLVPVLLDVVDADTELDRHPLGEQLGRPPLGDHQHVRVRHLGRRVVQLVHPPLHGLAVRPVHPQRRVVAAGGPETLDQAEVVEHLQGARLQALAAGTVERPRRLLEDAERHAVTLQLAGDGEAGRTGADDYSESKFSEHGFTVRR
jgi:hypothetical protein